MVISEIIMGYESDSSNVYSKKANTGIKALSLLTAASLACGVGDVNSVGAEIDNDEASSSVFQLDADQSAILSENLPFKVIIPNLTVSGEGKAAVETVTGIQLRVDELAQDINGGLPKREYQVITSADSYDDLKSTLHSGNEDGIIPDQIDFENNFIIAAHNGFDFTQHSMISVKTVEDKGDHYEVTIARVEPGFDNDHPYKKDPSTAYDVVKVPVKFGDKPVDFIEEVDNTFYDLEVVKALSYQDGKRIEGPFYVEKNDEETPSYPYSEVVKGQKSLLPEGGYPGGKTLLTNQKDLDYIWKLIKPGEDAPKFDFEKQTLLLVTSGEHQTTGFDIHVERIDDNEEGFTISVRQTIPRYPLQESNEVTTPYEIIAFDTPQRPEGFVGKYGPFVAFTEVRAAK